VKLKRKSKTLWWNGILVLILAIIELAAQTFSTVIPPIAYAVMVFISSAGNMVLRFYTSEAIK
jgi:hypothetical protein